MLLSRIVTGLLSPTPSSKNESAATKNAGAPGGTPPLGPKDLALENESKESKALRGMEESPPVWKMPPIAAEYQTVNNTPISKHS